jgi:hypothetical protein
MKDIIQAVLAQQGFRREQGKKHRKFRRESDGKLIVLPNSPSDRRSTANTFRDISRVTGKAKHTLLSELRARKPETH